ncbi:tRNA pseudouridine(13) synthase TruD [Zooshikella ganghwensis]|uniref:tRNA pseudouridine(13) synthase TruD n=1 Tax=Zooshikella ganghwensis TaxID=202772 RepID=UPI0004269A3D|nr:tRNA pseudouridine(13) synthase TruD [Zooshikella ganghwensis]
MTDKQITLESLPFAYGGPFCTVRFKASPEDFIVNEVLGFEPSGQGEHFCLLVKKTGQNTVWVADQLARFLGINKRQVSYCGLKDRHAVTRQWFSLPFPIKKEVDWGLFKVPGVEIERAVRHHRKLKRGTHEGNEFHIRLYGEFPEKQSLEQRLDIIKKQGVPNYFGEQRFGIAGDNIRAAEESFIKQTLSRMSPNKRSILLSTARSVLFNKVLASRVADHSWNQYLSGDVLQFNDGNTIIKADAIDDAILKCFAAGELFATGPLWGEGELLTAHEVATMEKTIAQSVSLFADGLVHAGLKQQRRSLVLLPKQLSWSWPSEDCLELNFFLAKGLFATTVIRELVEWGDYQIT